VGEVAVEGGPGDILARADATRVIVDLPGGKLVCRVAQGRLDPLAVATEAVEGGAEVAAPKQLDNLGLVGRDGGVGRQAIEALHALEIGRYLGRHVARMHHREGVGGAGGVAGAHVLVQPWNALPKTFCQ
jgi:hypothetical protein